MFTYKRISNLNISADAVFTLLQRSKTLRFVAWPVMVYKADLPEFWLVGQEIDLKPHLFGMIDSGSHFVTFESIDMFSRTLITNEYGGKIKSWKHTMTVVPIDENNCWYTDTVEVDAGNHDATIYLFVKKFYDHRHRRWQKLIK